jgi:DNA replication initiation complex subunit (GINS family)
MTNTPDEEQLDPADFMAVDSTPDEVRMHGDQDETESVQRNDGARVRVDDPHDEGGAEAPQ